MGMRAETKPLETAYAVLLAGCRLRFGNIMSYVMEVSITNSA